MKVPLAWIAAAALVVASVVVAWMLLTGDGDLADAPAYGGARQTVDRVGAPIGDVLSAPIRWTDAAVGGVRGYFFAISENRRLKREIEDLRGWRDEARKLKEINERYEALMGLQVDPPIPMVAARAVTDARGPFAQARLINAGAEDGVKSGFPVISENGLVGRIVGTTSGVSRVLMITDVASRVPVMIERTNARAILTGDGSGRPKLAYMRGQDPIQPGDRVVTSGDGGLFPRGIPVGVAARGVDNIWRVRLYADNAPIDYVQVLKFEDFSVLARPEALDPPAPPPVTAGAPPLVRPPTAPSPKAAATPTLPAKAAATPPPKAAAPPPAKAAQPPAPKTPVTPAPKTPAPATDTAAPPAPKTAPPPPPAATPDPDQ